MALKRKPSGTYYGDWIFDGKRVRRSSQTKVKRLAEEWYRQKDAEMYRIFRQGIVIRLWEDAVVGYMKTQKGKASYEQSRARVDTLDPLLKGRQLSAINSDLLTDIRDKLAIGKAPATVNRMMNFISAVLHYADGREWISRCPRIPKLEVPKKSPAYLTPDDAKKLLHQLGQSKRTRHLVPFVAFAIATGLRMRNITYLQWDQIDLTRKVLWVNAENSKNAQAMAIPLADDAVDVIRSQMGKHLTRVFTHRGKPYDRVNQRTLQLAANKAGVTKRVHPHLFRHTFASWHVMSGTTLFDLMKLGGWKKIESVLIYAHLSAEHLQAQAANRASISEFFRGVRNRD